MNLNFLLSKIATKEEQEYLDKLWNVVHDENTTPEERIPILEQLIKIARNTTENSIKEFEKDWSLN